MPRHDDDYDDDFDDRPRRKRKRGGGKRRAKSSGGGGGGKVVLIIVACVFGALLVCGGIAAALLFPAVSQARTAARRTASRNNLKQIGLALHNYHDVYATFPPSADIPDGGEPKHGIGTRLLPFIDQAPLFDRVNFDEAWTHPSNQQPLSTNVLVYQNPGVDDVAPINGYAISHYAFSSDFFLPNGSIRIRDISDGMSNTVMVGEVNGSFRAWGDPANVRSLTNGFGTGQQQFGSPYDAIGSQLLLGDGSVRDISPEADPRILKALSTPDGGEMIGEF